MKSMDDLLYRMLIPDGTTDALSVSPSIKVPSTFLVALDVIAGDYGVGEERKRKLKSNGYDVQRVQRCVNEIMSIFDRYGD